MISGKAGRPTEGALAFAISEQCARAVVVCCDNREEFPLPASIQKTFTWGAHTVILETGGIARQTGGAVLVNMAERCHQSSFAPNYPG